MIRNTLKYLGFVLGIVILSGCTLPDARHYLDIEGDQTITHAIEQRIKQDPLSANSRINVHVVDSMVLLTGQTSHASLKVQAEKIARSIPGVTRLYNEITIGDPTNLLQQKRDNRLTTNIHTKLLNIESMRAAHFKVTTENDVVYLIGVLTPVQSGLAMEAIRRTRGVKKAVNVYRKV
jgi:osmotically-inducible protein OsmY